MFSVVCATADSPSIWSQICEVRKNYSLSGFALGYRYACRLVNLMKGSLNSNLTQ